MFSFVGYNFVQDSNALDPSPSSVNNITSIQLQNGIYDYFHLTNNVTAEYSPIEPLEWAYLDIINANFNGNINGGNVEFLLDYLTAIKVKRRIKGTFNWVTLKTVPVKTFDDLNFVFRDYLNGNFVDYEYALVPILNGAEGDYITNSITSQFAGVFLCDKDTIYKYYAGVSYGSAKRVKKVGVFEAFGSQYPIVVSNALTNYHSGSVSGTILPKDYDETRALNRMAIVQQGKELIDFITNNKAKILKDWNGNVWLIMPIGEPTTGYNSSWGMGKIDVNFEYVEVGDANSESDLMSLGLIEPSVDTSTINK